MRIKELTADTCVLMMILGVEEASRPGALIDPYDITKKVALLVCIAEYDNTSLNFGQSHLQIIMNVEFVLLEGLLVVRKAQAWDGNGDYGRDTV